MRDTLFEECIDFESSIYTKTNKIVCMFNFENQICTSVTVIQDVNSDYYLDLIQVFMYCKESGWNTSLQYLAHDTLICRITKND